MAVEKRGNILSLYRTLNGLLSSKWIIQIFVLYRRGLSVLSELHKR